MASTGFDEIQGGSAVGDIGNQERGHLQPGFLLRLLECLLQRGQQRIDVAHGPHFYLRQQQRNSMDAVILGIALQQLRGGLPERSVLAASSPVVKAS